MPQDDGPGEQAEETGDEDEQPNRGAPWIGERRAALRLVGVGRPDDPPNEGDMRDGCRVPSGYRSQRPPVRGREQQRSADAQQGCETDASGGGAWIDPRIVSLGRRHVTSTRPRLRSV